MVNVVSNIAMNLTYIGQSITFLHNKVKREPKCLEYSKETTNVQQLYREAVEALENSKSLSKKLKSFKVDIYKIKDEHRFNPSDKIEAKNDCWPDDNLSNHKFAKIGIAIITLTSGIFLIKYFRPLHFIRNSF